MKGYEKLDEMNSAHFRLTADAKPKYRPLKLYTEKSVFNNKFRKVDLVLGDYEVFVELKLEPIYPGVPTPVIFSWESEGSTSIEGDLKKVKYFASIGKCAHFIVFDEEGSHARKMNREPWISTSLRNREVQKVHYMHVKYAPCEKMNH